MKSEPLKTSSLPRRRLRTAFHMQTTHNASVTGIIAFSPTGHTLKVMKPDCVCYC